MADKATVVIDGDNDPLKKSLHESEQLLDKLSTKVGGGGGPTFGKNPLEGAGGGGAGSGSGDGGGGGGLFGLGKLVPVLDIVAIGKAIADATGKIIEFGFASIETFSQTEQSVMRLDNVLRTMGETSGHSRDQLFAMNAELERTAHISESSGFDVMTQLSMQENIRGKIFERAVTSAGDLAVMMGTTAPNAARMLADALQNPEQGMMRLSLAGIHLTTIERERIKTLQESLQLERAQAELMDIVERKSIGAAAAKQGTHEGKMEEFGLVVEKLQKAIGPGFATVVELFAKAGEAFINGMMPIVEGINAILKEGMPPLVNTLIEWGKNLGWLTGLPGRAAVGLGAGLGSALGTDQAAGGLSDWWGGAHGERKKEKGKNLSREELMALDEPGHEVVKTPIEQMSSRAGVGAFEEIADQWKRISTSGAQRLPADAVDDAERAQAERDERAYQLAKEARDIAQKQLELAGGGPASNLSDE